MSKYQEQMLEKNSLIRLIGVAGSRHLFRWPLYISFIITTIIILVNKLFSKKRFLIQFSIDHSFDLFVLSISAVAIILTALGLIMVIYKKEFLKNVLKTDLNKNNNTFGGFVSPYVFGSLLWLIVAIISIFICVTHIINYYLAYIYLFFLIYSSIFIFYIITEIIEHVIVSIIIEDE